MRYLLDFIFANLIPIIIVVSVVIRIFAGIKKSAARTQAEPPVPDSRQDEEVIDVWSRLRPDNEEEDEDGKDEAPSTGPADPYAIRPLLMPAPPLGFPAPPVSPAPAIARPFVPVTMKSAAPVVAELDKPQRTDDPYRTDEESPQTAAAGPGPLDRLNSLPSLRRAVVLAEILGPPKGLD
jgi:hypothetical protein